MALSKKDIKFGDLDSGFQIGVNSGSIHLSPERPETQPRPSSTVPFLRDPDYVDRQALLERIRTKYSIPASRTALVGLGGVGKSQLAIEHCYEIRDRSPETWVFWVHGSNPARLEQGYREIADRVKITGRKDPKANIFQLVHDWLCDESNGKWHLILDNVDDQRVFHGVVSSSQDGSGVGQAGILRLPLWAYLSHNQNGSIMITTRNREVALMLVEQSGIIEVEPMDEAHALELFKKKLDTQGDSTDIMALVKALEFIPLVIVQAAAYIRQRAPRCSVQQYLEEFRQSDRKKTSLLNHEGGNLRRDWDAKNSVITTWEVSFDYIQQTRPSAADLLSLISFFDQQRIPEVLIRKIKTEQGRKIPGANVDDDMDDDEDNTLESISDDGFEDDILILRNYSFISVNADKTTFRTYALVQLATRRWLTAHSQLERWKQNFITNLCAEYPTGEPGNWGKCQSLFPHAKLALAQQPKDKDSLIEWTSLLHKVAWYAYERRNLDDAENILLKVIKARKRLFGQEDENTLSSMTMVGSVYALEGRWKEAEELQVQVVEAKKRILGAENSETMTCIENLALTYREQS